MSISFYYLKLTIFKTDPAYSLNICEGRAGRLSCPVGKVINVQQASYGRSSSKMLV